MKNKEDEEKLNDETGDNKPDYYQEGGFIVFTEAYLLERGYCCGNGCRHCPYDYKAVPEPGRSQLLAARKLSNNNGH